MDRFWQSYKSDSKLQSAKYSHTYAGWKLALNAERHAANIAANIAI